MSQTYEKELMNIKRKLKDIKVIKLIFLFIPLFINPFNNLINNLYIGFYQVAEDKGGIGIGFLCICTYITFFK